MITHDDMMMVLVFLVLITGMGLVGTILLGVLAYHSWRDSRAIIGLIIDERKRRGTV